jgi:hypothetical protein
VGQTGSSSHGVGGAAGAVCRMTLVPLEWRTTLIGGVVAVTDEGGEVVISFANDFTYAALLSLRTGSPSFAKAKKTPESCSRPGNGVRERGGAPKVTQFILVNWGARDIRSEDTLVESMWLHNIAATAPPAEWPVKTRVGCSAQAGCSCSFAAIPATIALATCRNPAWHAFSVSSRKPTGFSGFAALLTDQSARHWN